MKDSELFNMLIQCLIHVSQRSSLQNKNRFSVDDLILLSSRIIFSIFIQDFAVNISEFFGFAVQIGTPYTQVILKMTHAIWETAKLQLENDGNTSKSILGPFKAFVKRLPFLTENSEHVRSLTLFVLQDIEHERQELIDVDLTSQGKYDAFSVSHFKDESSIR